MTQVTEAIFSGGVLRPTEQLQLRDQERVRIIVQQIEGVGAAQRRRLLDDIKASADRMGFRSNAPYPTRDNLHERDNGRT
jgi:predicted DNA-binding antitoxin AbrB/MazE fold protein